MSHFDLWDFESGLRVAVIGANGGIGRAFVAQLAAHETVAQIYAFSRAGAGLAHEKVVHGILNFEDEASIEAAAQSVAGHLDLVIVASGMLHDHETRPEKSLRDIDAKNFAKIFHVNVTGPALVAKYFLKNLPRDRRGVFAALSARVGSIGDNAMGGWYAYRASKAALNMVLKNAAIEMSRRYPHAIVCGLHPGTVDSDLSEPFQGNVPAGKLFSPEYSTAQMLNVIGGLTSQDSGYCFAYDGERLLY